VSSDPVVVPETQPPRPRAGPRALAALILLGCFAVGVIVGGAGDRFLLLRQGRLMPRGAADFVSRHVVDRLDHELKLSTAQRQQIVVILERRHDKVTAIWEGVRPQVRAEVNATTVEINAVLTPEQRVKFAKIRANVRRRTRWMER
jgi:Spy/CpxP family protein refolding chaperone